MTVRRRDAGSTLKHHWLNALCLLGYLISYHQDKTATGGDWTEIGDVHGIMDNTFWYIYIFSIFKAYQGCVSHWIYECVIIYDNALPKIILHYATHTILLWAKLMMPFAIWN